MIEELSKNIIESFDTFKKVLPFKQYRVIRKFGNKKRILYYGNMNSPIILFPESIYFIRRLLK